MHQTDYNGASQASFGVTVTVDPKQLKTANHPDIKLRNLFRDYQLQREETIVGMVGSHTPTHQTSIDDIVISGVGDLIGLTYLHELVIFHVLQLWYDVDVFYISTGPILIAVNPFKLMNLYSEEVIERYRLQGESGVQLNDTVSVSSTKRGGKWRNDRLQPHPYQISDDVYRAMMRGLGNTPLMTSTRRGLRHKGDDKLYLQGCECVSASRLICILFCMPSRRREGGKNWTTECPKGREEMRKN